jgi:hypothetical protein
MGSAKGHAKKMMRKMTTLLEPQLSEMESVKKKTPIFEPGHFLANRHTRRKAAKTGLKLTKIKYEEDEK